jgi:hypothetical protein
VNLTVSPSSIGAGANFTASAKVVGGAGGVQYAWYGLPSDCQVGSGATVTCTPGTAGEYNLSVTVRDRAGVEASAAGTLEVRPGAAPSANPWGGPIGITIALGSVIGLVAVAVVVVRSRRRRPPPPTTEYVIVSGPRVVPPRRP